MRLLGTRAIRMLKTQIENQKGSNRGKTLGRDVREKERGGVAEQKMSKTKMRRLL